MDLGDKYRKVKITRGSPEESGGVGWIKFGSMVFVVTTEDVNVSPGVPPAVDDFEVLICAEQSSSGLDGGTQRCM